MALFKSREDFESRMEKANLNPTNCAYSAANSLVSFASGIGIHNIHNVKKEFLEVGNEPLEITIDVKDPNIMKHKADIMCAACGMCVSIIGGYTDMQQVVLAKTERDCPIFDSQQ